MIQAKTLRDPYISWYSRTGFILLTLSLSAFSSLIEKLFKNMDKNGDGLVTKQVRYQTIMLYHNMALSTL